MDSKQVLKATIPPIEFETVERSFYARIDKRGQMTVPKLTRQLMRGVYEESHVGHRLNVTLEHV